MAREWRRICCAGRLKAALGAVPRIPRILSLLTRRKPMPTLTNRAGLLALFLALVAAPLAAQEPNRNVRFGLPSPAKADPAQREDSRL